MILTIVLTIICIILSFLAGYAFISGCIAIHKHMNVLRDIRTRRFLEFKDYTKIIIFFVLLICDVAGLAGMIVGLLMIWGAK